MKNRSVPTEILLPHLVYEDVGAAIAWLGECFGFVEHYRYGDPAAPQGAQMHLGETWIMLTSGRAGRAGPVRLGAWTQSLTIFIADVVGHCEHARAKGVTMVEEPHETEYGEFQYVAVDLEGHHWIFSRHAKDVAPETWGAIVSG